MKFGKEFTIHLEKTLPEWRDKFLCYKVLKKVLKNIPAPAGITPPLRELRAWFVETLDKEVEKFNDFYVEKEWDFIIRFQALKERFERVMEGGSFHGVFTSEMEFSEDMMEIRKDYVAIHGEMILLKSYSSLNFAGLIKILKKYDKRTGEFLTIPFTRFAFHQPFFATEPLTSLVRECEADLEVLFPLEAEVVESTPEPGEHEDITHSDVSHASEETTLLLGVETADIYQSTRAAMRVIEHLRMPSSTLYPLSMSNIFGSQDNDIMGAVMDENSP